MGVKTINPEILAASPLRFFSENPRRLFFAGNSCSGAATDAKIFTKPRIFSRLKLINRQAESAD
jgi:hypothetical protein